MHDRDWKWWNHWTGLPVLAKVWPLNSLLSLWLALSMWMTIHSLNRLRSYPGIFLQKAFWTTELVTVRQIIQIHATQMSSFWTKTQRVNFFPRDCMLLSCYFSWFRSSKHSHGNGSLGYQVLIHDANFGRLLEGSRFINSLFYSTPHLVKHVLLLYICHLML